jgi:hypothetical protein
VSLSEQSTASLVGSIVLTGAFDNNFSVFTSTGSLVELNDTAGARVAVLTVDATGGTGPGSWRMFATRANRRSRSGVDSIGSSSVAEAYFAIAVGESQVQLDGETFSVQSEDNMVPAKIEIAHASDSARSLPPEMPSSSNHSTI